MWTDFTRNRRNRTQPPGRKAISRAPFASRRLWVNRGVNRQMNRAAATPRCRRDPSTEKRFPEV